MRRSAIAVHRRPRTRWSSAITVAALSFTCIQQSSRALQHRCDYWNYEDVSSPSAHPWPAGFVVHMPNVGRSWPLRIRNRSSGTPDPPPRETSLFIRTVSNTDAAGGTARHFGQGGCLCGHYPRIQSCAVTCSTEYFESLWLVGI